MQDAVKNDNDLPLSCKDIDDFLKKAEWEAEEFRKEKASLLGQRIIMDERLKHLDNALAANASSAQSVKDAIAAYREDLVLQGATVPNPAASGK